MKWRCNDCFGSPAFCSSCLRHTHATLIFHRISRWDGECFHRSSLNEVGVTLNLGHGGNLCPKYTSAGASNDHQSPPSTSTSRGEDTAGYSVDPADEEEDDECGEDEALWRNIETGGVPMKGTRRNKSTLDSAQCPMVTIVDITGVHELRARFCRCSPLDNCSLTDQLISMGLFPATMKSPRTAFTFQLLDDLNLMNLEGKVSTFKYFKKLRRLTSNAFPHLVPDRYRELMRALRQWRDLQSRQRAGELYNSQEESGLNKGGLTTFCAACPQPGINLPEEWVDDKEKYVKFMDLDAL